MIRNITISWSTNKHAHRSMISNKKERISKVARTTLALAYLIIAGWNRQINVLTQCERLEYASQYHHNPPQSPYILSMYICIVRNWLEIYCRHPSIGRTLIKSCVQTWQESLRNDLEAEVPTNPLARHVYIMWRLYTRSSSNDDGFTFGKVFVINRTPLCGASFWLSEKMEN